MAVNFRLYPMPVKCYALRKFCPSMHCSHVDQRRTQHKELLSIEPVSLHVQISLCNSLPFHMDTCSCWECSDEVESTNQGFNRTRSTSYVSRMSSRSYEFWCGVGCCSRRKVKKVAPLCFLSVTRIHYSVNTALHSLRCLIDEFWFFFLSFSVMKIGIISQITRELQLHAGIAHSTC